MKKLIDAEVKNCIMHKKMHTCKVYAQFPCCKGELMITPLCLISVMIMCRSNLPKESLA